MVQSHGIFLHGKIGKLDITGVELGESHEDVRRTEEKEEGELVSQVLFIRKLA